MLNMQYEEEYLTGDAPIVESFPVRRENLQEFFFFKSRLNPFVIVIHCVLKVYFKVKLSPVM